MKESNKFMEENSESVAMENRNKSMQENSESVAMENSNKFTEENSESVAMENRNKSKQENSESVATEGSSKTTGDNPTSGAMDDSCKSTGDNSKSGTKDDSNNTGENSKSVVMEDSSKTTGDNSKSVATDNSSKTTGNSCESFVMEDSSRTTGDNSKSVAVEDSSKSMDEDSGQQSQEEIEGSWMCALRKAVNLTIHKVAATGRYKVFASSFPALHEQYPQALRSLREQLITKLETAVKDEAEKMYSDHGIVPLLNQLEELSKQKRPGVTAWRPTGDVEEDLRAHTYPIKLKQRDRLKKIAEALTEENKQLRTAVEARRHKFHNTQQAVEDNIARVNQAFDACQNLPLQKLIDFVKKECM